MALAANALHAVDGLGGSGDIAAEGDGEAALLGVVFLMAGAVVEATVDGDVLGGNGNVLCGGQIAAGDLCLVACIEGEVAVKGADLATVLALQGVAAVGFVGCFAVADGKAQAAIGHEAAFFGVAVAAAGAGAGGGEDVDVMGCIEQDIVGGGNAAAGDGDVALPAIVPRLDDDAVCA